MKLRAFRVEGGGDIAQAAFLVGRQPNLLHGFFQLAETDAGAVFDHHLETAGLSQARNRWRNQHVELRLTNRFEPRAQVGNDFVLRKIRRSLVPIVVHNVLGHHVGEIGRIGIGVAAARDPSLDAGDALEDGSTSAETWRTRSCDAPAGS